MKQEDLVRELVAKVIGRLAERLGATGEKGSLAVLFTAATVEFTEAIQQVRNLVLDGFRIQLAFSEAAKKLLAKVVMDQLAGFPHITRLEAGSWLGALREASAVVVPLLSLNTLSKVSLLIADNLATNLMLHGLLMGRPVVVARNGADPFDKGRQELGFHRGRPVLAEALEERLQTVAGYGCRFVDVRELSLTVKDLLSREGFLSELVGQSPTASAGPVSGTVRRFITAAEVLYASRTGLPLNLGVATGMTPLARELAARHGVVIQA